MITAAMSGQTARGYDLLPTLAALTGTAVPATAPSTGKTSRANPSPDREKQGRPLAMV